MYSWVHIGRDQKLRHNRQFGATELRLRDLVRQDGQHTYVNRLGSIWKDEVETGCIRDLCD
ncbi:BQ5605_C018g08585 [Microbotryum silenes-dioicae]|uniref:BQ5605_C018g08585 protein n=1 Tax=Microbotryum silenes-dioicae TaxID=796604 RepID=A0A2X0NZT7_9BASI|nr:BQ5605_C018g08585 [Microbotryum silenes-dioicae]